VPHTGLTAGNMMPSIFMAARILGASLPAASIAQGISALAACACIAAAARYGAPREMRNSMLLTCTFLVSPYIYSYDMPIFTAGLIGIAASDARLDLARMGLIAAAWLLPAVLFSLNTAHMTIAPLVIIGIVALQLTMIRPKTDPA
jgi:hypothetical protein